MLRLQITVSYVELLISVSREAARRKAKDNSCMDASSPSSIFNSALLLSLPSSLDALAAVFSTLKCSTSQQASSHYLRRRETAASERQ